MGSVQDKIVARGTCFANWRGITRMAAALVLAVTAAVLSPAVASAKGGDVVWSSRDVRPHRQEAVASVVDAAGNVIVTGYRNLKNDPNDDFWTIKYRADGTIAWQAAYDQAAHGQDQALAVAVDANNDVIVAGFVWNGLNKDLYLVKYDGSTGAAIWSDTYNGPADGADVGTSLAIDRVNNKIYVGGYSQNGAGNDDYLLLRYANPTSGPANPPDGPAIIYAGSAGGADRVTAVTCGSTGVAVTGSSWNGLKNDIMTVAYGFGGSLLWEKRHPGVGTFGDTGRQVRFDSAGNVIVTGTAGNTIDYDIYTAKYRAADGEVLWEKTYNGAFDDEPAALWVDAAGDAYIAGYTWTLSGANDFYVAKYRSVDGAVVWQQSFNSALENSDIATATGIVVDETVGGGVYVTGYTEANGNFDFQTVKYTKAGGHLIWHQSFNGAVNRNDRSVGIGLAPDGNVYVTGWSDQLAPLDGGTTAATGGSSNTIQVSGKSWSTNQWQDFFVMVTSGVNAGAVRQVSGNSGDTLSLSVDFGAPVAAGDTYYLYDKDDYDTQVIRYDHGTLDPPTGLVAEPLSKQADSTYTVRLTWEDNATDEDGFVIERKMGEYGTWGVVATVGANVTTYDDPGLVENNYYYYRVKSYRVAEESYPSTDTHTLTLLVTYAAPDWSYIFDSTYHLEDYARAIAVGGDDHPVVTGESDSGSVGMFDYYTVKLNRADKSVIWADRFDSMQNEMDHGVALAVDSANNVVVTGFSFQYFAPVSKNIYSIFTLKYPSAGPPITWERQYNGPGGIDDRATAVASATDGSITLVVGYGKNVQNNDDIYLVKYLADGTQAWAATPFDGGRNDYPSSVALDAAGNVVIVGYSQNSTGLPEDLTNYDIFVAKYNGATGAMLWHELYRVSGTTNNRAMSVALDPDNDPYVTGFVVNAAGNEDFYTIKYNGATGARIWERAYDGPVQGDDRAVAVRVDPIAGSNPLDGNIVVVGTQLTEADDQDIHLIRYNRAGDLVWERTLQRPHIDDAAVAMTMDAAGYIYIAADSGSDLDKDILGVIYDYEGTLLGATVYGGANGGMDESTAIAVNHKGEAFIAGYSTNASGNADYAVIKQKNNYILVPTPFSMEPQGNIDRLFLTWRDNTPGTSFRIERTLGPVTSGSVWSPVIVKPAGSTTHTDTGLQPGTLYCYRISAENGTLASRKAVACATTALPSPSGLTLSAITTTGMTITWNNVAGNAGYKIERMPAGGSWSTLATLAADVTTYADSPLTPGTTYSYRISTNGVAGYSNPCTEVPAATLPLAPVQNAPTNLASTSVTLNWTDVVGETGYEVWRKEGAAGTWGVLSPKPGQNVVTFNDSGLTPNTQYSYKIRAFNSSGSSADSTEQAVLTKFVAPTLTAASGVSATEIDLAWSDVAGETGYTVEYASCSYSNSSPTLCSTYLTSTSGWTTWTTAATLAADTTTYRKASLVAGTAYRFRVTATVTGNSSLASNIRGSWTTLAQPVVTIVPASETSLTISWVDITGETNYTVERKLSTDSVWGAAAAACTALNTNVLSCTDTGLALQTAYDYRLKAYNTVSNANLWVPQPQYSAVKQATTPLPAPVLNQLTVLSSSAIDLAWSNVAGNTGYEIERCPLNYPDNPTYASTSPTNTYWGACTVIGSVPQDQTTYSSTGLTTGYTYRYRVHDLYTGGYSGWSNILFATTTPAAPVMNAPTNPAATSLSISWSNVYGDTGYSLEWKQGAAGTWTPVSLAMNTTTYSHTPVDSSLDYYYRVKAVTAYGSSLTSNEVSVLPAPTLNALSGITTSTINLSWNNVSGNNGYKIERKIGAGGSWAQIATVGANLTAYANTGCSAGTLYFYRVMAINPATGGGAFYSNEQSTFTLPTATTLTVSQVSSAEVDLAWLLRFGATDYKVERKTGTGGTWAEITSLAVAYAENYCGKPTPSIACPTISAASTVYRDAGLDANTTYCYQVKTANSSGTGAPSPEQCITTPSLASVVLSAAPSTFSVRLDWLAGGCSGSCETPDGYEVEGKLDSVAFARLAVLPSVDASFTQRTGINPNSRYAFRVRSYKGFLEGFDKGIQAAAWSQQGVLYSSSGVVSSSAASAPIDLSGSDGSARITGGNGAVLLATASSGGGLASSYNYSRLTLTDVSAIHDNFDVQIDYSLVDPPATMAQYHVYGRLHIGFPNGTGSNFAYVERSGNSYSATIMANGAQSANSFLTGDSIGKLRLTRMGDRISAYAWTGGAWVLIHEVTGAATAAANQANVTQYVQRNEAMTLKVSIDNFEATSQRSAYSNEALTTTSPYVPGANTCP